LKHVRRVESAHVTTNSSIICLLLTRGEEKHHHHHHFDSIDFDSWRAEPVVTKKSTDDKFPKKKPSTEILTKLVKTKRDTSLYIKTTFASHLNSHFFLYLQALRNRHLWLNVR